MTEFQAPPILASFVRWLLVGTKSKEVKEKRDEATIKSVNIVSQPIMLHFKTDRQMSYQPKEDVGFRSRTETPLGVGLALTVHKKTRSKELVNTTYTNVVNIEKHIACGVVERMKITGGFCLPPFVKRGNAVYFAADNIDFVENTSDGQNTLHGTILIINQNQDKDAGVYINESLHIPDEALAVDIEVGFLNPQSIKDKPMIFENIEFHLYDDLLKKYEKFDRTWFMASYVHRHRGLVSSVELSNARINRFSDGFFPSTSHLWNSLPSSVFPASFNLPSFKRQVYHHLRGQMA